VSSKVLALDPGPTGSALVVFDLITGGPLYAFACQNGDMRHELATDLSGADLLIVELTKPYARQTQNGHSYVPTEVQTAAFEAGRMVEAWGKSFELMTRTDVKKWLLGRATGTDANVRDCLYDRYGGSRKSAVGTKKAPGPLYGIVKDQMAALAVAVAWNDKRLWESRRNDLALSELPAEREAT
jgi:hypothetical protein